jgi:hypothetical protein
MEQQKALNNLFDHMWRFEPKGSKHFYALGQLMKDRGIWARPRRQALKPYEKWNEKEYDKFIFLWKKVNLAFEKHGTHAFYKMQNDLGALANIIPI